MGAFNAAFTVLDKGRFLVILVWLAVAAVGGLRASHLFNNLEDDLEPPSSSQSARADEALSAINLFNAWDSVAVVELEGDGGDLFSEEHANRTDALVSALLESAALRYGCYPCARTYRSGAFEQGRIVNASSSIYRSQASQLVSDDRRATVVLCEGGATWAEQINFELDSGVIDPALVEGYYVRGSSIQKMQDSNSDAAKEDMAKSDAVSIPVALLVLAWRVRSLPLLLAPVLVLPLSLLTAVAMLAQASDTVEFPNFSPALFTSVAVAMSFDWTLFLLTRYQAARGAAATNREAVREAVLHAGHTILLSGTTLVIAYCSLALLPVAFISAVGKGGAITILACMMVNLTLTPALLLAVPALGNARPFFCCGRRAGERADEEEDGAGGTAIAGEAPLLAASKPGGAASVRLTPAERRSAWYRLSQFVAARPVAVVCALLVLGAPLTYYATTMRLTIDQNQLHPQNTAVFRAWHRTNRAIGTGYTLPYALVAEGEPKSEAFFRANNELLDELVDGQALLRPVDVQGVTYLFGRALELDEAAQYYQNTSSPEYQSPEGTLYRTVAQNQAGSAEGVSGAATLLMPPVDPQGRHAEGFISGVRAALARANARQQDVKFMLGHALSPNYDVRDAVWGRFPSVAGFTIAAVLVAVTLGMRGSLVVAARMCFSVAVTLSWTYGAGVIVFQTSAFHWASSMLSDSSPALFWMAPTLTFSLLFGLACDYDLFLSTRVASLRSQGLSDRDAITASVVRTGPVITSAGLIMAVAFGALMASSQLLLVQAGFFFAFGTLVDTFVVRMLMVPSLLYLLGRRNWWPRRMPPVTSAEDAGAEEDAAAGGLAGGGGALALSESDAGPYGKW